MRLSVTLFLCLTSIGLAAQDAVRLPEQEQKEKREEAVAKVQEKVAQQANLEIHGNRRLRREDAALAVEGTAERRSSNSA